MKLFPQTISAIQKRLNKLKEKFKLEDGESPTGANTRLINPDRLSTFDEISQLERILSESRQRVLPQDNKNAWIGHKVTLQNASGEKMILHLATEWAVKYLKIPQNLDLALRQESGGKLNERLLSASSPLGEKIVGQSEGDQIKQANQKYEIILIETSEIFE
jgi:transcription elongation GreA/GreB family factor